MWASSSPGKRAAAELSQGIILAERVLSAEELVRDRIDAEIFTSRCCGTVRWTKRCAQIDLSIGRLEELKAGLGL